MSPEVGVLRDLDLTFTYVPSQLHHMFFELLKNSMRAVVENHETARPLPPVRLVVAQGQEDVTLKISDEGGGISRSGIRRIWTYLYTTAEPAIPHSGLAYQSDFHAPLAGLGYGLPASMPATSVETCK